MIDVFVNGVKLVNGVDFTATNGTTVVLTDALTVGQIVEIDNFLTAFLPTNALRTVTTFTATAGQTTFAVTYTQGLIDVFYNGSNLAQSEYTATNGTSVVLATACQLNDIVVVYAYSYAVGAFSGISGSGTTNYVPKFTGASTIGNSVIQESNSNIGIGGSASNYGAGFTVLEINNTTSGVLNISRNSTVQGQLSLGTNTFKIDTVGASTSLLFGINNAERMRLDTSGNLGLGTSSPTYKLDVRGSSGAYWNGSTYTGGTPLAISITNTEVGGYDPVLIFQQTDSGGTSKNAGGIGIVGRSSWTSGNNSTQISDMYFLVRNDNGGISERMRLTSSGNLGLGVTPSAWYTGYTALQVGFSGSIFSNRTSADTNITMIGNNAFLNSGATNWIYQNTGFATRYAQVSGGHEFYTAPSGTAGNAISFTQAMTLFSTGNLAVGTTTDAGFKLDVNGTGRFSSSVTLSASDSRLLGGDSSGRIVVSNSNTSSYLTMNGASNATPYQVVLGVNSINALTLASTGAATFSAATSAITLTTNGAANQWTSKVLANSTTGQSYGLTVQAGTNSSDIGFQVIPVSGSGALLYVRGDGNVGIGTSSPLGSAAEKTLQLSDGGGGYATIYVTNSSNSVRSIFGMQSSQNLGIVGTQTNTPFAIYTNDSERMRITSGGKVGIGTSSVNNEMLTINQTSANSSALLVNTIGIAAGQSYGITIQAGTNSSDRPFGVFNQGGTTQYFSILGNGVINTGSASGSPYNRTTGSAGNLFVDFDGTLYRGTGSSQRFKENITDWSASGLDTILALKPKTFTYKEDYYSQPNRQFLGLIAEEVGEVSPLLVDFKNEDGTGQIENVKYATIVVPLIKAIQELKAEIEQLKQK
jgi:hypothetical protein